MRLQVFLSSQGVCSRRKAMDIIQEGRVSVNGLKVIEPSFNVSLDDAIAVDGKQISVVIKQTIILHKPIGLITSLTDPHHHQTVMMLLPPHLKGLKPVGRLDKDSSGLLIFTNDGALAHCLMHPSQHIAKTYEVKLNGHVTASALDKIRRGLIIDVEGEAKKTAPCQISKVHYNAHSTDLEIVLHQGYKRQIRAMFKAVGFTVKALHRIAIGSLQLGALAEAKWRVLTHDELNLLEREIAKQDRRE